MQTALRVSAASRCQSPHRCVASELTLWWALEPQRLAVVLCYLVLRYAGMDADARDIGAAPRVRGALVGAFPTLGGLRSITVADLFACLRVQLGEGFKLAKAAVRRNHAAPPPGAAVRRGVPLLLRVVPQPPHKGGAGGGAGGAGLG